MNETSNSMLRGHAQRLRRTMTKEERRLWYCFFRKLPVTVHRQRVIGPYIVDFYCASAKLVVELDGSQHYSTTGSAADQERDAFLMKLGFNVIRYSNAEVNQNFDAVCADILSHIDSASVLPSP